MKFVKYPLGDRLRSVHDMNPSRLSLRDMRQRLTQAEKDLYDGYWDQMRVEDVYQEEGSVVMLAVTYFGQPIYARFPNWATYYAAMLNIILGEIK